MRFSPDSRYVTTQSDDPIVQVWDLQTKQAAIRIAHENETNNVHFSPDGLTIATASDDNTARVWNLQTNQEVARIIHSDHVSDVGFSPDGRYLLTTSDGMAELWPLDPDDLINAACYRLNRNLMVQEWQRFMGANPYQRTCENLDYPEDYKQELVSQSALTDRLRDLIRVLPFVGL